MTISSNQTKPKSYRQHLLDWLANSPGAHYPESVAPPILHFLYNWNLYLEPYEQRKFINPHTAAALTTNRPGVDTILTRMANNWLVHINAPEWLELAGLLSLAQSLRDLPNEDLRPTFERETGITTAIPRIVNGLAPTPRRQATTHINDRRAPTHSRPHPLQTPNRHQHIPLPTPRDSPRRPFQALACKLHPSPEGKPR